MGALIEFLEQPFLWLIGKFFVFYEKLVDKMCGDKNE